MLDINIRILGSCRAAIRLDSPNLDDIQMG